MEIKEQKQRTREELKRDRRALSTAQVNELSQLIFTKLTKEVNWSQVNSLHTYLPIKKLHEVDTWMLLRWLHSEHPHIKTYTSMYRHGAPIVHVHITKDTKYEVEERGIPLPVEGFKEADAQYDLIVVPTLGFDETLNRIGYGRAVYDHFLRSHPEAQKVGLCYEMGKVEDGVPTEEHDQKLDKIVTETEIYQ